MTKVAACLKGEVIVIKIILGVRLTNITAKL